MLNVTVFLVPHIPLCLLPLFFFFYCFVFLQRLLCFFYFLLCWSVLDSQDGSIPHLSTCLCQTRRIVCGRLRRYQNVAGIPFIPQSSSSLPIRPYRCHQTCWLAVHKAPGKPFKGQVKHFSVCVCLEKSTARCARLCVCVEFFRYVYKMLFCHFLSQFLIIALILCWRICT